MQPLVLRQLEPLKLYEPTDGLMTFSRAYLPHNPISTTWYGKTLYIIMEEFYVTWVVEGITFRLRCPSGYITDFASVPPLFWLIGFPPDGLWRLAALFHDILFTWQGKFPPGWFQYLDNGVWFDALLDWDKDSCDRFFLRIMKFMGVDPVRRNLIYNAVKYGGWYAWLKVDSTREQYRNAFVLS